MGVIETLIVTTALAGVVGTGLGGLIGAMLQKDSNRTVSLLLSFAGGVMLSVVSALVLAVLIGLHNIPEGMAVSVPLISGAMLYVVFGEILPQSILMYHSKLPAFSAIAGILVGMLIIF